MKVSLLCVLGTCLIQGCAVSPEYAQSTDPQLIAREAGTPETIQALAQEPKPACDTQHWLEHADALQKAYCERQLAKFAERQSARHLALVEVFKRDEPIGPPAPDARDSYFNTRTKQWDDSPWAPSHEMDPRRWSVADHVLIWGGFGLLLLLHGGGGAHTDPSPTTAPSCGLYGLPEC